MRYGSPDKLYFASKAASLLAGISVSKGNKAGIFTFSEKLIEYLKPSRSKTSITEIINKLSVIKPANNVDFLTCIKHFSAMFSKKCIILLISDLLFDNWDKALQVLAGSGFESYLLHILSPEELNPTFSGELTLTDIETLTEAPCHIGAKEISIYNYELESFINLNTISDFKYISLENIHYDLIITDLKNIPPGLDTNLLCFNSIPPDICVSFDTKISGNIETNDIHDPLIKFTKFDNIYIKDGLSLKTGKNARILANLNNLPVVALIEKNGHLSIISSMSFENSTLGIDMSLPVFL